MKNGEKPVVNPFVRLREEFDDWAILFDCDTGHGFGLSPTGVHVWKLLDGEHTVDDLVKELCSCADGVPEEAIEHVSAFIDELAAEGLAGSGGAGSGLPAAAKRPENFSSPPSGHACELKRFKYELPRLVDLSGRRQTALGSCGSGSGLDCTTVGSSANGYCSGGCGPSGYGGTCNATGHCAGHCCPGTSPYVNDHCCGGSSTFDCNANGSSATGQCLNGGGGI